MTTIAPTSENPTIITVTTPKLLIMLKEEKIRTAKPQTVATPETVIAVPICLVL